MGILPTGCFDQDLSQACPERSRRARRVEGIVRGHAGHDLGHTVAITVVGELGGRRAAADRGEAIGVSDAKVRTPPLRRNRLSFVVSTRP